MKRLILITGIIALTGTMSHAQSKPLGTEPKDVVEIYQEKKALPLTQNCIPEAFIGALQAAAQFAPKPIRNNPDDGIIGVPQDYGRMSMLNYTFSQNKKWTDEEKKEFTEIFERQFKAATAFWAVYNACVPKEEK